MAYREWVKKGHKRQCPEPRRSWCEGDDDTAVKWGSYYYGDI